jgi:hypothetical protein
VIATIMPITTNTTIAICVHIQVGDTPEGYLQLPSQRACAQIYDDMVCR